MSIAVSEVVLEGIYSVDDHREHIVRGIVNGKVFFETREENSDAEWSPGHAVDNPPSIESFAAVCQHLNSKPARRSPHDKV